MSLEQYYVIKFRINLQKSASYTFNMIPEAFHNEAMLRARAVRWHKIFKEGRQNVGVLVCERRPSTSITETVINTVAIIIKENRRVRVRQLHILLNISVGSVHSTMAKHLGPKRVCVRWISKLLT